MRKLIQEILQELKTVLSGKTLDAILPALLFVVLNAQFNLHVAVIGAGLIALIFGVLRILRKQNWGYAFGGLISVVLAGSMALIANNASNYFLPGIISNAFVLILAGVSLVLDKPMAAYASHITRGWKIDWFWLKTIKPAYREVTWIWTIFFLMRTVIQLILYTQNDLNQLVWANTLLGLPFTIIVLVLSYIYGIWRLKTLKGPGIDEYIANEQAPYRGQNRGF